MNDFNNGKEPRIPDKPKPKNADIDPRYQQYFDEEDEEFFANPIDKPVINPEQYLKDYADK